ncbi:MAG: methylaspartate ammonia-lyase [Spirochaetaceae bacterium]|nr:methylaspartate ammonia-lyase [Spirochaetaceae bacterium]
MRIARVLAVPVRGGFFTDDQAAIRDGRRRDGFTYDGAPVTAGFVAVRQPAEAVSVLLELEDGQIAHGDCASVQYAGAGGRDPLFSALEGAATIERAVAAALAGRELASFRDLAEELDALHDRGRPLHSALRYGVTQAALDAVARARGVTMAEVVRDDYHTGVELRAVGVFAQCGDDRYDNVDKMVLKGADALPHGLINNVAEKVGPDGELLLDYVRWVRERVFRLRRDPSYQPLVHLDVYGTLGHAFGGDIERLAEYLARLAAAAAPLQLRVEHPLDAGSRDAQVAAMAALRRTLAARRVPVQLAVDEWCNTAADVAVFVAAGAADVVHVKVPDLGGLNNTIESLLLVRRAGLRAYCGGSATETDRSAQVTAHVAMACAADQVLAKPGMGVDEGMMVVGNEMARVEALVRSRRERSPDG